MTSEQFVYWLQGIYASNLTISATTEKLIKDELAKVLAKKSMPNYNYGLGQLQPGITNVPYLGPPMGIGGSNATVQGGTQHP